ncbi:hypothetical protein [Pseudomonas sp. CFBP 13727]|uniref:hypothetical protein n=1 Tax=Pseudomonas sp. CFBP 13727 TaxID=2775295 RepID=UPI00177D27C5|nr:hypothetical protein [Pseudomonas sp. CFBP 13727]MBD8623779.1 hypothetical protein [Pseudomonas sp. CFBP 13727]
MRSLRVLVLEDIPYQLIAMHQVLNACGVFDVLTAQSFNAACLSLEKRQGVDIVICEMTVAGLDMGELIGHLAATGLARALVIYSNGSQPVEPFTALVRQHRLPLLGVLHTPVSAAAVHGLLQDYQQSMSARALLPLLEVHEISHFEGARSLPLRP